MIDLALISYVAVMSVTPGPNNLLLAASGVNFGFRRTLPMMFGISSGHLVQVFVCVLVFGTALTWFEGVRPWLALVGCVYLLVLSWQLFRAGAPKEGGDRKPLRFHQMALFQFINPKAWVLVTNTALLFTPRGVEPWVGALTLGAVCAAVNLPCISVWAFAGDRLRRLLSEGRAAFVFNLVMALLMGATAVWLLVSELGHVLAAKG